NTKQEFKSSGDVSLLTDATGTFPNSGQGIYVRAVLPAPPPGAPLPPNPQPSNPNPLLPPSPQPPSPQPPRPQPPTGPYVAQLIMNRQAACVLVAPAGKVKCWGNNDNGELGATFSGTVATAGSLPQNLPYVDFGNTTGPVLGLTLS
ncbi:hypothetical protein Agub_g9957, partial [Astrephomene gubernaculifera]